MATLKIDGNSLKIEDVIRVGRDMEKVELTEEAKRLVQKARDYVDQKLASGAVIYGLTTGFGKFSNVLIAPDETAALQRNLIISHSCAMGDPLPEEISRAVMLLRCNALSKGNSGIRLSTIQTMIDMLNKGVHPVIPRKGSLGASGDLAPLSHMVLVMLGEGEAFYKGERMPGAEAMKKAGIPVIELAAKEGLALINGTQIMTAIGCFVVDGAKKLCKTADIAAALTGEALLAITKAYDPKVHAVRGHQGQIDCAANMLRLLEGSNLAAEVQPEKVQDAYALRCVPQVHGACRDCIKYAYDVVSIEINAVTDNPIIFPDEDDVISGGNFHGEPVGLAMDFVAIGIAELADISERRCERLVNPALSEGLPAFLTAHGGVCSGLMIAQYAAASMVSENKVLAHPACVDSIPSSANQEDHVSMGTTAARKALSILDNSQKVLGIELFAASQAISFRDEKKLGKAATAAYKHIRKTVDAIDQDIISYIEMNKFDAMVKSAELNVTVENAIGNLL